MPKYDIVSIEDLARSQIERIFDLADEFAKRLASAEPLTDARGLIMATLFYEPSTRTRLSFESAMHRLGGAVISSPDMHASSATKGESLADTVRVVASYADVIVLRHPHDGAATVAAEYAPVPVINAGDGSREHPTQTLCDLYLLRKKIGDLKGRNIAICGDLKFGRTAHSLMYALARFQANIVAFPNPGMAPPEYVLARLTAEEGYDKTETKIETIHELASIARGLDIAALYLTPRVPHQSALLTGPQKEELIAANGRWDALYLLRFQRERHPPEDIAHADYVRFDSQALKAAQTRKAIVMHPLPRTDELATELDSDNRAVYFEQAAAGVPVRMALLAWLLEREKLKTQSVRKSSQTPILRGNSAPRCLNPHCITRHESTSAQPKFKIIILEHGGTFDLRCDFCDRAMRAEYVGHVRSRRYYKYDDSLYEFVRSWIEERSIAAFETAKEAQEKGYEPYRRGPQREIMTAEEIAEECEKIAEAFIADAPDLTRASIVGIVSSGAILGKRLRNIIMAKKGVRPSCGSLDLFKSYNGLLSTEDESVASLNGDDPFPVVGRTILLVDDVISSGWTVQQAMTALWQRGRPATLKLAVLVDRGHRAVPIQPDYVAKSIHTSASERVQVRLAGEGRKSTDRVVLHSTLESLTPAESRA